jgi:hypothetical protein
MVTKVQVFAASRFDGTAPRLDLGNLGGAIRARTLGRRFKDGRRLVRGAVRSQGYRQRSARDPPNRTGGGRLRLYRTATDEHVILAWWPVIASWPTKRAQHPHMSACLVPAAVLQRQAADALACIIDFATSRRPRPAGYWRDLEACRTVLSVGKVTELCLTPQYAPNRTPSTLH